MSRFVRLAMRVCWWGWLLVGGWLLLAAPPFWSWYRVLGCGAWVLFGFYLHWLGNDGVEIAARNERGR